MYDKKNGLDYIQIIKERRDNLYKQHDRIAAIRALIIERARSITLYDHKIHKIDTQSTSVLELKIMQTENALAAAERKFEKAQNTSRSL